MAGQDPDTLSSDSMIFWSAPGVCVCNELPRLNGLLVLLVSLWEKLFTFVWDTGCEDHQESASIRIWEERPLTPASSSFV